MQLRCRGQRWRISVSGAHEKWRPNRGCPPPGAAPRPDAPKCVLGEHYFAAARGQAQALRVAPCPSSAFQPLSISAFARFNPQLLCNGLRAMPGSSLGSLAVPCWMLGVRFQLSAFSVSAQITHAQPKSPVRVNFRMFEREFPLRQQLFRDHGRTVSLELATSFLGEFRLKISGENRYSQFCFSTSGARLVWGFIRAELFGYRAWCAKSGNK